MKVLYFDLETTGLHPATDQIIEIAAVLEDLRNPRPLNQLPKFHSYVKHDRVWFLDMHLKFYTTILPTLSDDCRSVQVQHRFLEFLRSLGLPKDEKGVVKVNVGGKNTAGFDYQFLKHWLLFRMEGSVLRFEEFKFGQRVVDPAVLFWEPSKDDKLPDTNTCVQRAGLDGGTKHDALGDTFLILKCVRRHFGLPIDA